MNESPERATGESGHPHHNKSMWISNHPLYRAEGQLPWPSSGGARRPHDRSWQEYPSPVEGG